MNDTSTQQDAETKTKMIRIVGFEVLMAVIMTVLSSVI
jgi:hypothetical protein